MSTSPAPSPAPKQSSGKTPTRPTDDCEVVFVEPDGNDRRVSVLGGQSLMDAALNAGVKGILGQCGGAINCATCLCDFNPEALSLLPPPHADETELLHYVDEASTNSRLTCQLYGHPTLHGLVARVVVSIASPDD